MTTGALVSMPATVLRRSHSAARVRDPRLTRPQVSHARIRCTAPCALAIRDASLSASGPHGSGVAEQHDERHRGACADSAQPPVAATRDGKSAHTPRRSRRSRDRNAGRCAPAPRSGDSCRAGRSAPTDPPRPPPQRHWTAPGEAGIKGLPTTPTKALSTEGPGVRRQSNDPGLRLSALSITEPCASGTLAHSAAPSIAVERRPSARPAAGQTALRLRRCTGLRRERKNIRREESKSAPIARITRVLSAIYSQIKDL
jgi:hypothetical protein